MESIQLPESIAADKLTMPQLSETAYRCFLAEQRLLSFVYYVNSDRCELIDAQTHATADLSERVSAALLSSLLDVLRGAAASGKSFIHRQEVNGRLYSCFGFVNTADGKVETLEGFLVPESGTDTDTSHLFGRRRADRDSFTGLYTKVAIKAYARNLLESNSKDPAVFCMVDLDYFKEVNDTYGHDFGDTVIMKTAEVLSSAARGIGMVGRFGGDEFFIVLHKPLSEVELRDFLRGFRTKLESALLDTPQHIKLHCSVGVSRCPANGTDYDELFAKADRALYIAKQKGRNRYIIYREALHGELTAAENTLGEKTIRTALHIDDSLHATEVGIDRLYRAGAEALPSVLREIALAYEYDGAAVFSGVNLNLLCEAGSSIPLDNLSVINTPTIANLIDATGMYTINFQQMHEDYYDEFHGLLERCGVTTFLLYRIGSKAAPLGALLLHSRWEDNAQGHMPSDEQRHILGLLAYVIGKTLL